MFFVAYIILPLLILGNLILIPVCLINKKIHPLTAFFCVAIPLVVFFVQYNLFPAPRKEGFIVLVRYPEYFLVQTLINGVILVILRMSLRYEKNPRRNYYRDHDPDTTENSGKGNEDLLDG